MKKLALIICLILSIGVKAQDMNFFWSHNTVVDPFTITLDAITSVTYAGFTATATITNPQGENVTSRGVVFSTSPNPTFPSNAYVSGSGDGTFTVNPKVNYGATWYVRAYALIDGNVFRYSNEMTVTTPSPAIGDSFNGGIVAYIFKSTDYVSTVTGYVEGETHGIIAQSSDLSDMPYSPNILQQVYPTPVNLGAGMIGTNSIVSTYGDSGTYAARACLNSTAGGKSDWCMPSDFDLQVMYPNRTAIGLSTGSGIRYWSTVGFDENNAIVINMLDGSTQVYSIINNAKVRAIRYF